MYIPEKKKETDNQKGVNWGKVVETIGEVAAPVLAALGIIFGVYQLITTGDPSGIQQSVNCFK